MSPFNTGFKALSDPTRRKIIELLNVKPMTAGEIAEQFNISKPSISHHLNLLKQADMITSEKKGQYIIYNLNTTVFQDITKWFFEYTSSNKENK